MKTKKVVIMGTEMLLRNGSNPKGNYTNPEALSKFPNLEFISQDGYRMSLNRAVFASQSKFGKILTKDTSVIFVPVSMTDLRTVLTFMVTGCIPFGMKNQTVKAFLYLGVKLVGLKFSKIYQKDVPKCQLRVQERYNNGKTAPKRSTENSEAVLSKMRRLEHTTEIREAVANKIIKTEPFTNSEEDDFSISKDYIEENNWDDPVNTIKKCTPLTQQPSQTDTGQLKEDFTAFTVHPQLAYKCEKCFFGTNLLSLMKEHKVKHSKVSTDNSLFYFCPHCTSGFSEIQGIKKHVCPIIHCTKRQNVTEVNLSQEDLDTLKKREKYGTVFINVKPKVNGLVCVCEICNLVFPGETDCFTHRHQDHQLQPPNMDAMAQEFKTTGVREKDLMHNCNLCLFGTNNPKRMFQHEMRHKEPNRKNGIFYFCEYCHQGFHYLNKCEDHSRYCDKNLDGDYQGALSICKFCDEGFHHGQVYRDHVKICEELQVPTKCVQCGQNSKNKQLHRKHLTFMGPFHTDRCNQCDAEMESFEAYTEHISLMHKSIMKYGCGLCELVFDTLNEKEKHRY